MCFLLRSIVSTLKLRPSIFDQRLTVSLHAAPYLVSSFYHCLVIWRASCFRKYPTMVQRYGSGERPEPQSWRDEYFVSKSSQTSNSGHSLILARYCRKPSPSIWKKLHNVCVHSVKKPMNERKNAKSSSQISYHLQSEPVQHVRVYNRPSPPLTSTQGACPCNRKRFFRKHVPRLPRSRRTYIMQEWSRLCPQMVKTIVLCLKALACLCFRHPIRLFRVVSS